MRADADYEVRVEDFEAWEREHGKYGGCDRPVAYGFRSFWPDRVHYLGTEERGADAAGKLHFPGLDPEAAAWLAETREIAAVGLDTPSIDHGPSREFESHVRLFRAGNPRARERCAPRSLRRGASP